MRTDVVAAAMIVAFSLGGCVSHTWVAGPDVHATFAEQTAQCRIIARHGGSGFYASGSPGFVAGAAIGNAIGNAVQANADFNDCMAANGWEIADQQSAAVPIVVPPAPVAVATKFANDASGDPFISWPPDRSPDPGALDPLWRGSSL